jgi:hypothetical protein
MSQSLRTAHVNAKRAATIYSPESSNFAANWKEEQPTGESLTGKQMAATVG